VVISKVGGGGGGELHVMDKFISLSEGDLRLSADVGFAQVKFYNINLTTGIKDGFLHLVTNNRVAINDDNIEELFVLVSS
jgi:hypothetical protein